MRFYDVDGGSILVDGVDTKEMTRHELRDRFGMVLQDAWLFEGSIRDNIAYAQDNLPEEKNHRRRTIRQRGQLHQDPARRL